MFRVYNSLNRKVIDSVVLKLVLSNVDYRLKLIFWSDTQRPKWRAWRTISSATLQFIVIFDTFQCGVQLSHPFAKFSHGEFTTLKQNVLPLQQWEIYTPSQDRQTTRSHQNTLFRKQARHYHISLKFG